MIKTFIWIIVAAFVIVIVYGVWTFLSISGGFDDVQSSFGGQCRTIGGVVGAEDLQINHSTGLAYIAALNRRIIGTEDASRGMIYRLDMRAHTPVPVDVTPDTPADFQPHGVSLIRTGDGFTYLFVVNHPQAGGHTIEVFEIVPSGINYVETITYDALTTPNDLVAVGPRSFYATNDIDTGGSEIGQFVALLLALPLGSVSYFDGAQGTITADDHRFANGINISPDGRTVYVAEMLGRQIILYDRNIEAGILTRINVIPLPGLVDNMDVDEEGALWVTLHPRFPSLISHSRDEAALSPSQIVKIDPTTGKMEQIYLNSGEEISGASVGAAYDNKMLIGSIFEPKILLCRLP
ncbi:MAG: SMP-30/gluconolactonase/LRE family protein [Parvularculales bacterium]